MYVPMKIATVWMVVALLLATGCGVAKGPPLEASSPSSSDPYERDLKAGSPLWSELSLDEAGLSGTTSPYPPTAGQLTELIVWFHYSYEYMPMEVAYRIANDPPQTDPKTSEVLNYSVGDPPWHAMKVVRVIQADYALRKDVALAPGEDPHGRSNTVQVLTAPLNLPAGTHYLDFKVTYPTDIRPHADHVRGWPLTVEVKR